MPQALLYTAFHLNLAFSSIPKEHRPLVVERCYWPLLRLAEEGLPIGVEATGYTLCVVHEIDPQWIAALRKLLTEGKVELIGSGYTQMIGPLVPPEMTRKNLALGHEDYEALLGVRPKVALINEQAYSASLLPLYQEAGYQAVMMDWAEPSSHHRDWRADLAKRPQMLQGRGDCLMPVIWSDAISFQKFQRYAHGELEADEYLAFLSRQIGEEPVALPLYTSDAEIFDFRPGRFNTEAGLSAAIEFERIALLMRALKNSSEIKLGIPSEALASLRQADRPLRLETPEVPVPVKKQRKYNIMRWALTGRDDLRLNTYCWRLFEKMQTEGNEDKEAWRALCRFWASDYRTHITEARWSELLDEVPEVPGPATVSFVAETTDIPQDLEISQSRRFLHIQGRGLHLVLNMHKGLAVQSFGYGEAGYDSHEEPAEGGLIGTLGHGYYDDIAFGADFYTGHLVCEPNDAHKITDLSRCTPQCTWDNKQEALIIEADIPIANGEIQKQLVFFPKKAKLVVSYNGLECLSEAVVRLAHVTLNPRKFSPRTLYFKTHNGGAESEPYYVWQSGGLASVDHGRHVSRLVSARTGVGMTSGLLEVGDDKHYVKLEMARTDAAGLGLITCQAVDDSYFMRAGISLREIDETSRADSIGAEKYLGKPIVRYSISIGRQSRGPDPNRL